MSQPFMQLYVADYLGDTRHLTTEQHGAYLLLLMTMWRAEGRLPNCDKKLARIVGATASRWAKIKADVLEFFEVDGESITNKRLMFELKKASEKSIKRAEAGTRGGAAKALKDNKTGVANASALSCHSSEPEPDTTVTNVPVVITPTAKGPDRKQVAEGFLAFWQAYPLKKGKDAAAKAFAKALTRIEEPDPLSVILAGIERCQREWDDPKYIPHPATWLNQGRWADEETPQPTNAPRARHERPYRSDRAEQRNVWSDILAESTGPHSGGAEPLRIEGGLHEGA